MAHVKLSPTEHGHGTKTEVNGVELPDVSNITVRIPATDAVRVDVEMFVTAPFVYESEADVHVHLHIPADHALIEIEGRPGLNGKRFQVTRVLPAEE